MYFNWLPGLTKNAYHSISYYEKNAYHTISYYKKNAYHTISYYEKKCLSYYFIL